MERPVRAPDSGRKHSPIYIPSRDRADLRDPLPDLQGLGRRLPDDAGVGGESLAPMPLPVLGGLLISDEVVDSFFPVRFYWVRRARWLKLQKGRREAADNATTEAVVTPPVVVPSLVK